MMKKINVTKGADGSEEEAAFCEDKMAQNNVGSVELVEAMTTALRPFAGLLRDGAGVAVVLENGRGSIIGVSLD